MSSRRPGSTEETVARILEAADEQFRRVGYAKTAVADIARALDMSPANIYRFFPSKSAINEAIAQKFLNELHALLRGIVAEERPAAERLERFVLEKFRFHRQHCVNERRLHDMVTAAMEEHWDVIEAHIELTRALVADLVADGIRRGEFAPDLDPVETAQSLCTACTGVLHPALIAQFSDRDLEAETKRLLRLLLRALAAPRRAETSPKDPERV